MGFYIVMLINWFLDKFRRKPVDSFYQASETPIVLQAQAFLSACTTGNVKNFIVVAEVIDEEGLPQIATMGACSLLWGRTALSTAIADFPITTH